MSEKPLDFIRTIVRDDVAAGKNGGKVVTRFPPEPNGYLHIGHAKAICISFGIAEEFDGQYHLRFDDTNPIREEQRFVDAMIEDIHWLGFDWGKHQYFASDYFERLFEYAVTLIKKGKAYVDSLTADEIRVHRGTLTEPGRDSPYRNRNVEENLDLFLRMRQGEFVDGTHVLRAKIDMASPNIVMRDPTLYRIRHEHHHRTGNDWCIYPMYDFAHCLSDAIEGVTHSLCSLEFENNRALYDWIIAEVGTEHVPRQYEFARLNLSGTTTAKRKLRALIEAGHVDGWDDPRMPTLVGLRRRGYTPESIRTFIDRVGVAKAENTIEMAFLEHCLREHLNKVAPRVMGVLRPLKVVIENYPEGQVEEFDAVNNPEDEKAGTRKVPFSRELYIERDDFREDPPRKFFRLAPGREVRLRAAYFVTCTDVIKDASGEITELRCTYDPETRGGDAPDGRKVKSTMHWVSAKHAVDATVRLYETLLTEDGEYNPESLATLTGCKLEPSVAGAVSGTTYQFERTGYFCVDEDSTPDGLVFNRAVSLRDTWARLQKQKKS